MQYLWFLFLFLFVSCSRHSDADCEQSPSLPPIWPDYTDVTLPVNMAAPTFMLEGANYVRATFANGDREVTVDGENEIAISLKDWQYLSTDTVIQVKVRVWDEAHPKGIAYAPFRIYISPDTIDRYITYRLIPPGYEWYHQIGIFQRDLSTYDEHCLVSSKEVNGCVNCHTACQNDASRRAYHLRGPGGGTVFTIDGKTFTRDLKERGLQGSYMVWNPDGRSIVFASTETHQSFYHRSRNKIEGYDLRGNMFAYDIQNDSEQTTPYFTDSLYWHTVPAFAPDGRTLYFCRARAVEMPHEADSLRYSIMAVDYDPETCRMGDNPRVIVAATDTSSCSFPRVTPDGRYLMYSAASCGTLTMYHSESDLHMVNLQTGEPVDISSLNSEWADSYHTFSRNGRWVVFSSRRVDGRYTRLFFSHIDAEGHVTKPFLLPQRSPLHNVMRMDSYNVPEFINEKI